jgi:hypothetical protein
MIQMMVSYALAMITSALERARVRHERAGQSLLDLASDMDDPWNFSINVDRLLEGSRFLLCGSDDGDSMYCWRTYGAIGSVGCAIGLDPAIRLGIKESSGKYGASWQAVSYSSEELEEQVDMLIDEIVDEYQQSGTDTDAPNFGELIVGYARIRTLILSIAKSPSYADEKESRITVTNRRPLQSSSALANRDLVRVAITTLAPAPGRADRGRRCAPNS